jgi:hypothetical protein
MGAKSQDSDKAFQQEVNITNAQASVFDGLKGVYGSTRGDVMNNLIQLGLQSLRGKRTLVELIKDAKAIRRAAPDVAPLPRSQRKKKAPSGAGGEG